MTEKTKRLIPDAKTGKGRCPRDGNCVFNDKRKTGVDFCVLPRCILKGR